jgi:hypothetical protein
MAPTFILHSRGGEIATNRLEGHGTTMPVLHPLRKCLVRLSTGWRLLQPIKQMDVNEQFGLIPRFWGHINPYGTLQPTRRLG